SYERGRGHSLDKGSKASIICKTRRLAEARRPKRRVRQRLMKKRQLASITGAELRVLEELWQRGEATIRDLRDVLYPQGGNSKFATVQKLLARLVAKKLVSRRKDEANWVFQALIARDALIGGELHRLADRLSGNSM